MSTVIISPKFQVVIPKLIRDALKLKSGQRVEVLYYDNRIELVPIQAIKKMRGFLKDVDSKIERDQDRV